MRRVNTRNVILYSKTLKLLNGVSNVLPDRVVFGSTEKKLVRLKATFEDFFYMFLGAIYFYFIFFRDTMKRSENKKNV